MLQGGNISPIRGEAPTVPIETKICMAGNLADVVTCAKFQDDIFRGYNFTGGRISNFPIDFCMGLMRMTHLAETGAVIQREFPARVATKLALVSSASFQRENMADDEDAVAAACAIVAILADSHNRKRKNRDVCIQPRLESRTEHGAYHALIKELQDTDVNTYLNFLQMDHGSFEFILQKVSPIISKCDMKLRDSISAAERLALTLRYLATGVHVNDNVSYCYRMCILGILMAPKAVPRAATNE